MKRLPIGIADYKKLIDENCYYIDKTLFIEELWKRGGETTLIPRPRRFGKTLNMSMLKYFFEKTNTNDGQPSPNAYLFHDKKIWQIPEMRSLQGTFPVIFITFKDVKQSTWHDTKSKMIAVIAAEYMRHRYLLTSDVLEDNEKAVFENICAEIATPTQYHNSLFNLSEFLHRYHHVKPIVMVDEYDSPIHAAYLNKYYPEVVEFIRGLFGAVFKDNSHLGRGIITGILRTAKEGIFSGLNNLEVFTILDVGMSDSFGFTQQEIDIMLRDYSLTQIAQDFKAWYNGYLIGTTKIYNPWSSLNCVKNSGAFKPYWANTSDNALVGSILATAGAHFKNEWTNLLSGKQLEEVEIEDKMVLPGMLISQSSIWSLLFFSGYITMASYRLAEGINFIIPALPNKELTILFKKLIDEMFKQSIGESDVIYLEQAFGQADGKLLAKLLKKFITQSMSCYDISADEPEKSYHLFILGILVTLGHRYAIRSNKEAGYGRYDIALAPHDKSLPGIVIEFKKQDEDETMQECADRALVQIKSREYVADLQGLGYDKIVLFGIAIHKKDVLLVQELSAKSVLS